MLDEIAVEKRIRWDHRTDYFLGVCREHAHNASFEFCSSDDMDALFQRIDDDEIHYASEVRYSHTPFLVCHNDIHSQATVGALCLLSDDKHLNSARLILVSGTCKRESGQEHAHIIQTLIDAIKRQQTTTTIRTISIASDGETK